MNQVDAEWQRWVEAAKVLARDPTAQVLCPRHGDAYLQVTDVSATEDPSQVERYLRCPVCGATNVIRNPRGR
jgi:uncharacterized C2H2 Zn-finger protein